MKPMVVRLTAAGNSAPILLNSYGGPAVSLQMVGTGGATGTIQQTLDDPQTVPAASINWLPHPDAALVGVAAAAPGVQGNYAFLPRAIRVVQAGAGTMTLTVLQARSPT